MGYYDYSDEPDIDDEYESTSDLNEGHYYESLDADREQQEMQEAQHERDIENCFGEAAWLEGKC